MIRICAAILLILFISNSHAQIRFSKGYDYQHDWDVRGTAIPLGDSGYFAINESVDLYTEDTLGFAVTNLIFMRINKFGDTLWTKQYRKKGFGLSGRNLLKTSWGYLFVGEEFDLLKFKNNNIGSNVIVWLLNEQGDTVATKNYSIKSGDEFTTGFIKTLDGGFAISGQTCLFSNGSTCDAFLLKLDSTASKEWHKIFAVNNASVDAAKGLVQYGDSSFYLYGRTIQSSINKAFLIKTNSKGKQLWKKSYSDFPFQTGDAIQITIDNNILLIGNLYTTQQNNGIAGGFVAKVDTAGNNIWLKRFLHRFSLNLIDGIANKNGNYSMTGVSYNYDTTGRIVTGSLLHLNSLGDSLWERFYYGKLTSNNILYNIKEMEDGYVMSGFSTRFVDSTSNQDFWLVKVDTFGCLIPGCQTVGLPNIPFNIVPVKIYPNPANEYLNLSHSEKIVSYRMADMLGRIVLETRFLEEPIDIRHLKTGPYIIQVMLSNGSQGFGRFLKK